jgi:branched-chain amino acid transport system substrate-binding protein
MRRTSMTDRWRNAAGAGVALLSGFGCSLVVDSSLPAACGADSDCAPGGACVGQVCTFAPAPACNSNTECVAAGSEYCVNGQCIANPVNADCSEVVPRNALSRDSNKLLLGFIGDIGSVAGGTDPDAYGTPPLEGVQLALEEIQINGGLPALAGGTLRRPLAMLVCKEVAGADQDYPVRMARHLVEQARVPAIIGASFSGDTLDIWDGFISSESSALLMSPSATSPTIAERTKKMMPGNDLQDRFWRTAPSDAVQAELLRLLARDVRDVLIPLGRPKPRVLQFIKGDAAGTGLRDALADGLKADFGPDYLEESNYDEIGDVDWDAQANRALRAPYPDIILGLGTTEFVEQILPKIEAGWPQAGTPRPWYVLPEGDRTDSLRQYAAQHPEFALNARLVGTAPGARRSTNYGDFEAAFGAQFDGRSPGNLAEFGYDAAYLLVYAIAGAKKLYPSAIELGQALNALNCADPGAALITPGTTPLDRQFELVASGACVDFSGASGELDFDTNGEAVSDIATWCLRRCTGTAKTCSLGPDGSGFALEPTLGQYYDAVAEVRREPLNLNDLNWCPPVP